MSNLHATIEKAASAFARSIIERIGIVWGWRPRF